MHDRSFSNIFCFFAINMNIQLSIKMLDNLLPNSQRIDPPQNTALIKKASSGLQDRAPPNPPINTFSKRSLLSILLIIFCTFEVILITNSKVYIDSSLIRSFLTFYADQTVYPEVFQGDAFYIYIQDVGELQTNMQYMLQKMNNSESQAMSNLDFSAANITLQVQYHVKVQESQNQTTYIVNPAQGIFQPFDLSNTTSIQLFLLKTHFFEIVVDNLEIKNQGLEERYIHRVIYHYDDNSRISMNFQFNIDSVFQNTIDHQRPQDNELLFLRIFYVVIIVIAFLAFYHNMIYVRRACKEFYTYLERKQVKRPHPTLKLERSSSLYSDLNPSQIKQIDKNIFMHVQANNIDINNLQWKDYVKVVEFQVIFALLASSLQIISNFYLIFGREHEELIGLGCLFAWMTLFRTLHNYQKLTLMYQLIKLSILRVIEFSTSFFLIFMGFVYFGVTVFPRVRYFASVDDSVTTLVSMMAGDSIDMFTMAIRDKYSSLLAISYIFSYVILFMHAIHNTLTSIIKEYFILRKIELIYEEKERLGEQEFIYLEEMPIQCQKMKSQLPIKRTFNLEKDLWRMKNEKDFKAYEKIIRTLVMKLQGILLHEKIESIDYDEPVKEFFDDNLRDRLAKLKKTNDFMFEVYNTSQLGSFRKKTITNQQL